MGPSSEHGVGNRSTLLPQVIPHGTIVHVLSTAARGTLLAARLLWLASRRHTLALCSALRRARDGDEWRREVQGVRE